MFISTCTQNYKKILFSNSDFVSEVHGCCFIFKHLRFWDGIHPLTPRPFGNPWSATVCRNVLKSYNNKTVKKHSYLQSLPSTWGYISSRARHVVTSTGHRTGNRAGRLSSDGRYATRRSSEAVNPRYRSRHPSTLRIRHNSTNSSEPPLSYISYSIRSLHDSRSAIKQWKHNVLSAVKKGKVFPYSLPSVGPGADPGVQAVSPQVT